ncbi:MAG: CBASS cGAMP-activated phospholipase [Pseudomonadota bacterium]
MSEIDIGDGTAPIGTLNDGQRFQVLALSGGGYRGLYSASVLATCEAQFKTQVKDRFDLIAGTSIGALLSAALACGVPAKTVVEKFMHHGPKIFPKSKLKDAARLAVRAPYDREPLEAAIDDTIGQAQAGASLRDLKARLLIISVNATTGAPALFTSGGLSGAAASPIPLRDAILASAAAPSFFPVKKIGTDDHIDGGVLANAPDLIAYGEARRRLAMAQKEIFMLSIGTAGRRQGAALKPGENRPGGVSWLAAKGLVQTIMASQEALAVSEAKAFLGERHLRIDEEPAKAQEKAIADLDQADDHATQTLISLAQLSWSRLGTDPRLRDYFVD